MIRPTLAILAGVLATSLALAGGAGAQTMLTLRDHLLVLNSSTTLGVATQLVGAFAERYPGIRRPELRTAGTAETLDRFCSGIGPETPDIAIVARRMPSSVVETCRLNEVRDIVELQIGLGAIVLATNRGDPAPALSSRQVYEALAAERVSGEAFAPNTVTSWSQLSPHLPNIPIRVIVPVEGSGTRQLFDDLVLEAGCREVRGIRLVFEAAYRRSKCVTMREDGTVIPVPLLDVAAAVFAAPPGTIGVMTLAEVTNSGGNLVALALDGVDPSPATVSSLDYDQTRVIYLYAKRQHARNQRGVGVVRGVSEILVEATREAAVGPGGYLANAGLIPLPPADRLAQRQMAERMTLMPSR